MKLKKIAALALAGVMAVSMLAGCAGKGTDDKKDPTDLSSAVIAQLSSDTTKKVTFTKSTDLDNAITAALKKYGNSNMTYTLSADALHTVNDEISAASTLTGLVKDENLTKKENVEQNLAAASMTVSVANAATAGSSTNYAVKTMAAAIDEAVKKLANAPAQSGVYTLDKVDYRITYSYTGNVSVYTETAEDTGIVSYYLVYTITRTGTAAKV